ncbi:MAG: twin-arginine translocase TatA/TatE family subunit [Phototrophicales bacterium]|nr:twin-arginine translocase TatA/TatE family subunit [Phototrophicales bacterium]
MGPGIPELLLILVIVMLLFGVGRISKVGGELGNAVANFRKGLSDGKPSTPPVTEEKEQNV